MRSMGRFIVLLFSFFLLFGIKSFATVFPTREIVTEDLTLVPLPLDRLSHNRTAAAISFAYLKFSQTIRLTPFASLHHTHYFPLSLSTLFSTYPSLRAFSASLVQGQWKSTLWGTSLPLGERQDAGGDVVATLFRDNPHT